MATTDALIAELKARHETAGTRAVVAATHLFGAACADDLDGHPINDIAAHATGHRPNGSEIRAGVRLAKHVRVKIAQGSETVTGDTEHRVPDHRKRFQVQMTGFEDRRDRVSADMRAFKPHRAALMASGASQDQGLAEMRHRRDRRGRRPDPRGS